MDSRSLALAYTRNHTFSADVGSTGESLEHHCEPRRPLRETTDAQSSPGGSYESPRVPIGAHETP